MAISIGPISQQGPQPSSSKRQCPQRIFSGEDAFSIWLETDGIITIHRHYLVRPDGGSPHIRHLLNLVCDLQQFTLSPWLAEDFHPDRYTNRGIDTRRTEPCRDLSTSQ